MKIIIKDNKTKEYILELTEDMNTIQELKIEIHKKFGIELNKIKLLYKGKILDNNKTLKDYQITDNSQLIFFGKKNDTIKKDNKMLEEDKISYSSKIKNLIDMGYEKEKAEKAIYEAKGDFNLSIEILNTINNKDKNEDMNMKKKKEKKKLPNELRNLAIYMKILTLEKPDNMNIILNNLNKRNMILLNQIEDNEKEFLNILSSTITKEDIDVYKKNYLVARQLLSTEEEQSKQGKVQILLTEDEDMHINELHNLYEELNKEDIIAAYIMNDKKDVETKEYLKKYIKK